MPFVAVDSSTIQSTTAESTLFGHEKGAFTGADRQVKGVFEEADGGIVYFDELANMPIPIQAKLLRVLQEKEVTRLGSTKTLKLEFRVVCATNRNLEEMAARGEFKEDVLQRLNVLPIHLPSLRERAEDIPLLVSHFLKQNERTGLSFSDDALDVLKQYSWPGNIRELANVLAFTTTLVETDVIEIADLPPKLRDVSRPAPRSSETGFYEQVAQFESQLLTEAYSKYQGNISKMALGLGMDRSHLYTKLKEFGLHSGKNRKNTES